MAKKPTNFDLLVDAVQEYRTRLGEGPHATLVWIARLLDVHRQSVDYYKRLGEFRAEHIKIICDTIGRNPSDILPDRSAEIGALAKRWGWSVQDAERVLMLVGLSHVE